MCNQLNFLCVACPAEDKHFPSFSTFREVRAHSLQVHGVVLEAAVQSATVLPDKLAMFLCLLCASDERDVFISETSMKQHLESHSPFFLQNWNEFVEIQCRICESVVPMEVLKEHVHEQHPLDLFASNDSVTNSVEEVPNKDNGSSCKQKEFQFLPDTSQVRKKMRNRQDRQHQPVLEEGKLWDDCFKPDKLISKYFTKISKIRELSHSPSKTSKTCLRIKPLGMLQEQAEISVSPPHPHLASPRTPRSLSRPRLVSPCSTICSNNGASGSVSIAPPNERSRSRSSSVVGEIPPSRTWWSNKQTKSFETEADCYVCGLHIAKNRLIFHNQYYHMDMLFRCMMDPCRRQRTKKRNFYKKDCFMFPAQLHRHHQEDHHIKRSTYLDTSRNMTGLPASLVKISCSQCSKFMLTSDVRLLAKHAKLEHRDTIAGLLFNCRLCNESFNSVEEVIQHSKTHRNEEVEMRDEVMCYSRHRPRGEGIRTLPRNRTRKSRNRSSSSNREPPHYHINEARLRSSKNTRWHSGRSSSRSYPTRSRSTNRNSRDFSKRSHSRKSRRPLRSRSRTTVSSLRRSSSDVGKEIRSHNRKRVSPSRSPHNSRGRGRSKRKSKYEHSKKDGNIRLKNRPSSSRSSSRNHVRLRGKFQSQSSSPMYFSYRAKY